MTDIGFTQNPGIQKWILLIIGHIYMTIQYWFIAMPSATATVIYQSVWGVYVFAVHSSCNSVNLIQNTLMTHTLPQLRGWVSELQGVFHKLN